MRDQQDAHSHVTFIAPCPEKDRLALCTRSSCVPGANVKPGVPSLHDSGKWIVLEPGYLGHCREFVHICPPSHMLKAVIRRMFRAN
eukprot:5956533-Amphidinium_carterae.1